MRSLILLLVTAGLAWPQGAAESLRDMMAVQTQIEALMADVAAAQARLEDLKKRYTDSYPGVQTAQRELVQLELRLNQAQIKLERARTGFSAKVPTSDATKLALPDLWWRNPATAQYLGLTAAQALKMDDVVTQYKPVLMDGEKKLKAAERALYVLVSDEPLDEAKASAQVDAVAFLRSELEKTNGHMLLGIRKLLTPEQWTKLNQSFTFNLTKEPAR